MAAMLLWASCTKEQPTVTVHFTVQQEGFDVLMPTKAAGDGTAATQMMVGVFDAQGNAIEGLKTVVTHNAATGFDFDLQLVGTLSYKIVLWAQSPDRYVNSASWTAAGLGAISLTGYSALSAEADDAFTAYTTVPAGSNAVTVDLVRPFAQVSVATTADLTGITQAQLQFTGVPAVYNACTGTASGSQTISVAGAPILGAYATDYIYIGYAYVPAREETATATINLGTSANPAIRTKSVQNLPLKANYRTNILGNI